MTREDVTRIVRNRSNDSNEIKNSSVSNCKTTCELSNEIDTEGDQFLTGLVFSKEGFNDLRTTMENVATNRISRCSVINILLSRLYNTRNVISLIVRIEINKIKD